MVEKIISGGQTGADQAALRFAMKNGISHGGWCPKGRISEEGRIPKEFHLQEMATSDYPARTRQNVLDSDGTAVISIKERLSRGSSLTLKIAQQSSKPVIHIHEHTANPGEQLCKFIEAHGIRILNVAGPRRSSEQGIEDFVTTVLSQCFRPKTR